MRRAAAAPVRIVQPRFDQPLPLRCRRRRAEARSRARPPERRHTAAARGDRLGRARRRHPALRPLPRRRHRPEPLPDTPYRGDDEADAQDRPRCHGLGRRALPPRYPLRQRRGDGARRPRHGLHPGPRGPRIDRARSGARRLPGLARLRVRPRLRRRRAAVRDTATPPARRSPPPARSASSPTVPAASSRRSRSPSCASTTSTARTRRRSRGSRK